MREGVEAYMLLNLRTQGLGQHFKEKMNAE